MSSRIEKRCSVCGAIYWKYRSEKKKTCGKAECIAEQKRRHQLPRSGVCGTCGEKKTLLRKGRFAEKRAQCRSCWNKEHRVKVCSNCGKTKRIYSQGVCQNCFFKLKLSKRLVVCIKCGREKPHYAKGLCPSCYSGEQVKKWQREHPEHVREYYNRWMKAYLKQYRKDNHDKVTAWQHRYREQFRRMTPERIARVRAGTAFMTTDDIGVAEGKIHAKCVGKFYVGRWGRIIIYEMPKVRKQPQMYKLQMVDIKAGMQSFISFPRDETVEFLEGFGIVFRPAPKYDR
jgi:hypothetical protein